MGGGGVSEDSRVQSILFLERESSLAISWDGEVIIWLTLSSCWLTCFSLITSFNVVPVNI